MPNVICEWGLRGIESVRTQASVFIIVDVLSFSTAVSVAVDAGATVIPFPWGDPDAAKIEALKRGARAASPKRAAGGQLSLSPASLRHLSPGERVLLPSPNGSRLSLATGGIPTYCASLRNYEAVARVARTRAGAGTLAVIAAGERWPDDSLRPALEDWLGAGAVVSAIAAHESVDAEAARVSFETSIARLGTLVRACRSGQELLARGFEVDVDIALEIGTSTCVPLMIDGEYVDASV